METLRDAAGNALGPGLLGLPVARNGPLQVRGRLFSVSLIHVVSSLLHQTLLLTKLCRLTSPEIGTSSRVAVHMRAPRACGGQRKFYGEGAGSDGKWPGSQESSFYPNGHLTRPQVFPFEN